jgi:type I restriction enzyme R subunit
MQKREGLTMPTTDTSEKGLESIIVTALTGLDIDNLRVHGDSQEPPTFPYAGAGYVQGEPADFDRAHALDLVKLLSFLQTTQPRTFEQLHLETDGPERQKFLARLQGEVTRRGVVDVLRNGIQHGPASVRLFFASPSPGNQHARQLYDANIFSVTRQLRYSLDETQLALDLCLFINGLPVATFELKNELTNQTVDDAVQQYQRDRNPRELLFQFGRCLTHFAVDDQQVKFCTKLAGKDSLFLPFNKGYNDGAGNPPDPSGIKTRYLWHDVLTRQGLTDIIENYAQIVEEPNITGHPVRKQIFPRYHQLDVVHRLLADARDHGVGKRYLIQHSAGSGKSNSIAWLAHQLVGLRTGTTALFDSVVVVTDRRLLDKQIKDTIKQFAQVTSVVGHADSSADLRILLQAGKKIIITTIQKFPFVLDAMATEERTRTFAIIIDEAHSSQGGRTATEMNMVLSGDAEDEDIINQLMESRKMLTNASYFAFTATPKNKTLEIFGDPLPQGGKVQHHPFHSYTMKQAIQEGFILDVLQNYTPVNSYYRLVKAVQDDPEFDVKKAEKKLRAYVESDVHVVRQKTQVMVDHFLDQVIAKRKVNGQARAMVVTGGIARAIDYYHAITAYLMELESPWRAIVAFSGEHDDGGRQVSEATLNGFPSSMIPAKFKQDPYRFLVCADKFQTGYDEPLLHTMYVDKVLSGIKAVQTLSRLNRSYPGKRDTFVLDFANDADTIRMAFEDYYRTTILSDETDPNKLHDLKATLDGLQVYTSEQVEQLVTAYLHGADREQLDPVLDTCVTTYQKLGEDAQVSFKGDAKAFVRTYAFLGSILPYNNADWEKLSIFLNLLVPKLPSPIDEDDSEELLKSIDLDSYRSEMEATIRIELMDGDAEIRPVPVDGAGGRPEAEMQRLSEIIESFNDLFSTIPWQDKDKIRKVVTEEIPTMVAADTAYQNAMTGSDKQHARIEHDSAMERVLASLLSDNTELFKQFSDNPAFRKWLLENSFKLTYKGKETQAQP